MPSIARGARCCAPARTRARGAAMSGRIVDLGDARFARDVQRVHSHGAAFLCRLLSAWGADKLLRSELESLFQRAAVLDSAAISATGADRWPSL